MNKNRTDAIAVLYSATVMAAEDRCPNDSDYERFMKTMFSAFRILGVSNEELREGMIRIEKEMGATDDELRALRNGG